MLELMDQKEQTDFPGLSTAQNLDGAMNQKDRQRNSRQKMSRGRINLKSRIRKQAKIMGDRDG